MILLYKTTAQHAEDIATLTPTSAPSTLKTLPRLLSEFKANTLDTSKENEMVQMIIKFLQSSPGVTDLLWLLDKLEGFPPSKAMQEQYQTVLTHKKTTTKSKLHAAHAACLSKLNKKETFKDSPTDKVEQCIVALEKNTLNTLYSNKQLIGLITTLGKELVHCKKTTPKHWLQFQHLCRHVLNQLSPVRPVLRYEEPGTPEEFFLSLTEGNVAFTQEGSNIICHFSCLENQVPMVLTFTCTLNAGVYVMTEPKLEINTSFQSLWELMVVGIPMTLAQGEEVYEFTELKLEDLRHPQILPKEFEYEASPRAQRRHKTKSGTEFDIRSPLDRGARASVHKTTLQKQDKPGNDPADRSSPTSPISPMSPLDQRFVVRQRSVPVLRTQSADTSPLVEKERRHTALAEQLSTHENILGPVTQHAVRQTDTHQVVFQQVLRRGVCLYDRVHQRDEAPLTLAEIQHIALQILNGIEHCHDSLIIHRDLKSKNIILTRCTGAPDLTHIQVKVGDLEDGTHVFDLTTLCQYKGTTPFLAPELLQFYTGKTHTLPSYEGDIWSFGLILAELITRRYYYQINSLKELIPQSGKDQERYLAGISHEEFLTRLITECTKHYPSTPELKGLLTIIQLCLAQNPQDRPSATDLKDLLKANQDITTTVKATTKEKTTD